MTTGQRIDTVFTLFVRLLLAGIFAFAAYMKLRNPAAAQAFAESIQGFKLLDPLQHHHLTVLATFAVPWLEILCAAFLILGFWTRAASFAMLGAMGVFIWAISTVIERGMNLQCGCFGEFSFPCGDTIGMCHLVRNSILAAGCLYLVIRGGGRVSIDRLLISGKPKVERLGATPTPTPTPTPSATPTRPVSSRPASDDTPIALDPVRPTPLSSSPSGVDAAQPPKPRWD
ncbi:MAG: DoxX family membrane protein [Phycisphaeraceae bacterium]|nr:DoxX family membrane protein [Phycisphaeraceae bacterium]